MTSLMTGLRGTEYDPWQHAESMGIRVMHRSLEHASGLWVPTARTVILRPRMRRIAERTVLAHELGHAYHLHADDRPKHELQADRFAAWHLIDDDELCDVARESPDPSMWSHALGVTLRVLRLHLFDNHRRIRPNGMHVGDLDPAWGIA